MLAGLHSMAIKVFCTTGLIFVATVAHADTHVPKAGTPQARTAAGPTHKWATDQVLRTDMENIRQTMIANQEGIEKERLSAKDYQRLAEVVDRNIADIVKNCRLAKDADAAFHDTVLADMSWGSEMMRTSPKVQVQRAGALAVMQALRHYGEYFQHPGWKLGSAER